MATATTPTKSGTEFLIKNGLGDQQNVVMQVLKDGSYVVTWLVSNGVVGQHYGANDSKIGLEFMVSKSASDQHSQQIAALSDGGFVVSWISDPGAYYQSDVFVQRFDKNGTKLGSIQQVNSVTQGVYSYPDKPNMDITPLKNGGYIVSWVSSSDIYGLKAHIYGANGISVRDEFYLFKQNVDGYPSSVIALENGNIAVNVANLVLLYDNMGNKIGDSFHMNTYGNGVASPTMTALKDGGFITAWSQNDQDGDGAGVFAQRFDGLGNTVGTEFQVNTYTTDDQYSPSAVGLPDGGFLITWNSWMQEADPQQNGDKGNGIFAQRFGADNLPKGSEFQVNTTTDYNQDTQNVIAFSNDTFVVAWQSEYQNAAKDYDLYAQRFSVASGNTTVSLNGTNNADSLLGDAGNNTLTGLAGNDTLNGAGGDDILKGGAGNDLLNGNAGFDVLIGGAGADVFKLSGVSDTGIAIDKVDVIVDFKHNQGDKINLSAIDANSSLVNDQAFTFVKTFGANAMGQLYFDTITQMLYGSTDADKVPEFAIQLSGVTTLVAADFIL